MVVYNDSFMNNATSLLDIIVGVGSAAGNDFLVGNLMLISFFLCFLILSLRMDFKEVLIMDGFLTSILAILLYTAGMVAAGTITFPALIFFITLVIYFMT